MLFIMTELSGKTRRGCAEKVVETEEIEFYGVIERESTGGCLVEALSLIDFVDNWLLWLPVREFRGEERLLVYPW